MILCEHWQDMVIHNDRTLCPLCEAEKKIEELESKIEDLTDKILDIESKE